MDDAEIKAKASHGLAILEALADAWAAEVDLTSMIKNVTSPMELNERATEHVKTEFRHRMEVQMDAIVRQAFQEGAYRAITGLQDERDAMERTR